MRIAIVLFLLFGVIALASGYLHSNITHVFQPGEYRNFYLPEQTGSISLNFLEGGSNVIVSASPQITEGNAFSHDSGARKMFASRAAVTNDWYPFIRNENDYSITVTFEIEVYEPILTTGKTVNLSLIPYAFQYIIIPPEINHGLSFHFDIQCEDGDSNIMLYFKPAHAPYFDPDYDTSTRENEEMLVLVSNESDQPRTCTLFIVSKATVVLTNGLNILTVDNSDTPVIGTRYTPTSPSNNVLKIQTNPSVNSINYERDRAYSLFDDHFITDGQTVQNFLLNTANLDTGDQLNVTVTPIPTVMLTSGVQQTFQCVNSGDHHVFALVGNDNRGSVLKMIQLEGLSSVTSYYFSEDTGVLPNNDDTDNSPFTRWAESNHVVWMLEAICASDSSTASITATLPVHKPLSIGKNVITLGTEESYFVLPEGPDQTTLGVRVNSSSVNGWFSPENYQNYDWGYNSDGKTNIGFAYNSKVVSPAWYFFFYALDVAETVELTLTAVPVVLLENGKTHIFTKPDESYDHYTVVGKVELSNGMGHALPYHQEYNIGDSIQPYLNSFYSDKKKRTEENGLHISPFGNSTWYFVVRPSNGSSVHLTPTFVPVTTAVNGVVDFSRIAPPDEKSNWYRTFLFPAARRQNSLFKYQFSSEMVALMYGSLEGFGTLFRDYPSHFASLYNPDSLAAYFVIAVANRENATIHIESIPTIGVCNSQYDCNGHGSCGVIADQCTCTDDYSGDWCEIAPPRPTFSDDNDNDSGARQMVVAASCHLLILMVIFMLYV